MADLFQVLERALSTLDTAGPAGLLLGIGLAFLGGVVSSLLPCTLAMVPVLAGYMGAFSQHSLKQRLLQVSLFVIGIASVMALLGVLAGVLGWAFGAWLGAWSYALVGVILLLMGAYLAGWVPKGPLSALTDRLGKLGLMRLPKSATDSNNVLQPFILGACMGLIASPCGTPYLAAILAMISYQQQWLTGGLYLFAYALGQGVLLIFVGLGIGWLRHLPVLRPAGAWLQKLSGLLFIALGAVIMLKGVLGL
ncbi:MAG: cytochrome c biogenesis protein CcdA [Vampirovibrionales bacterium]|nr:cytochrome c biogenesis protein CcdA [Vampirovibrionales bacterium]